MYAVINDRGNQLTVAQGDIVELDLMDAQPGQDLLFDQVLLVSSDSGVTVGAPTVEGAAVTAQVVGPAAGKKIYGLSFRRRKNSSVRTGHRQKYTMVQIKEITL